MNRFIEIQYNNLHNYDFNDDDNYDENSELEKVISNKFFVNIKSQEFLKGIFF